MLSCLPCTTERRERLRRDPRRHPRRRASRRASACCSARRARRSASAGTARVRSPVLNFCANNYLGLSSHPRVIAAARAALDAHGYGLSSVRFICGTQDAHKELEAALAPLPRHRGRDPLLVVLRRERRPLRDAPRRARRDHLRRAQPRVDHRRHPPLQGRAPPLRARRHGRARGHAREDAGQAPAHDRDRRRLLDGRRRRAARAHLRSRREIPRARHGRRQPRDRLRRQDRPRHDRALRRAWAASTSSRRRSARRSAARPAASPRRGAEIVELLRQRSRPYLFSNTLAPAIVGASLAVLELLADQRSGRDRARRLRSRARERARRFRDGHDRRGLPHPARASTRSCR